MTGHAGHSHRSGQNYYLNDIPLDEAWERFDAALEKAGWWVPSPGETLPLADAQGRVTAGPVWAQASSPNYDASAMDGVAVKSWETAGATETAPVSLAVGVSAAWVDTGDPMPAGFDAVVMIEDLDQSIQGTVQVTAPVAPWQHVRPLGEDIVATELALPESHVIRAVDLGTCAAAGLSDVLVRGRPRVEIIPTGNELVPVGTVPKPGDIVEFNSLVLAGMVRDWGGDVVCQEPVRDDLAAIRAATSLALAESDVVVINAGSSAGSEDYTAGVVAELGELLVHGIAIRPGHPVVLGVAQGKPVIGLPGYPVSAAITAELLVRPLIRRKLGLAPDEPHPKVEAVLTRKTPSPPGEDEFLRVQVGQVGDRIITTPIQRGAGVITSLSRADGLLRIPRFSEGLDAGSVVSVDLLRSLEEIRNTIVCIGSHDPILDLISSALRRDHPAMSLSSSHVGSLGGLLALRRGEAHLAGCHLLDENTGEYNVAYIRRYLPEVPVKLVNLVGRVQGLIVPQGNPLGITGLAGLAGVGVKFVNRQRGSGTRVLLDYRLTQLGLSPDAINGYQREEYSHLAVAAAVQGGAADVGLGVLSAARALQLGFVPLLTEQYQLVIPREHYDGAVLEPLLRLLGDPTFQEEVEALGGYDVGVMGTVAGELG